MKTKSSQCRVISSKQLLFAVLFLETVAIAIAIGAAVSRGKWVFYHFDEGGFITILSCAQILVVSVLARNISGLEKRSPDKLLLKNAGFWLIVSIGAFFLALDDALSLHEQLDMWMHQVLDIKETMVTDLADDIIVGIYLILALIYVASQWQTLQIFRSSFTYFKVGFLLATLMVILDILSNNNLFVSMVTSDFELMGQMITWINIVEEAIKLVAEGFFLAGVYRCWRIVDAKSKKEEQSLVPSP
ncbi:MAG: hypothetical protein AAFQ14_05545 [Cyanobacteria bacterium J06621_12]